MDGGAVIVLQARMGSSRLPGKVLQPLAGRTQLAHCIQRLVASAAGPVVVATTDRDEDTVVEEEARGCGVRVLRGPALDVLARFVRVVDAWPHAIVLRATADNPAVDIDAPRRVLQHLAAGADYVVEAGLPVGAAVEGVRADLLRLAAAESDAPYDREHVTAFVRSRHERFRIATPSAPAGLVRPDLRFTVDTPADLAYMREVLALAGAATRLPTLAEVIAAADRLRDREEGSSR